jgi:hypothetical protein
MKTIITYQVERAPVGSASWEQLRPVVASASDADTLFAAEQIKSVAKPVRLRIVRTVRSVTR